MEIKESKSFWDWIFHNYLFLEIISAIIVLRIAFGIVTNDLELEPFVILGSSTGIFLFGCLFMYLYYRGYKRR